jgi:hypothetical protein
VLAATSRGDAIVLGLLLVLAVARPTAVLAVGAALAASSLRWGATSLEALSGAQAVLGPAGWVGPTSDALGSWLAAAALLVALARRSAGSRQVTIVDLVLAAAAGATVAAVVAGPAPGGDVWLRILVALLAGALALLVASVRRGRRDLDLVLDAGATVVGLAALVAVRADGGGWAGLTEMGIVGEGAAIAVAVGVAVLGGCGALALRSTVTGRGRDGAPPQMPRSIDWPDQPLGRPSTSHR